MRALWGIRICPMRSHGVALLVNTSVCRLCRNHHFQGGVFGRDLIARVDARMQQRSRPQKKTDSHYKLLLLLRSMPCKQAEVYQRSCPEAFGRAKRGRRPKDCEALLLRGTKSSVSVRCLSVGVWVGLCRA